MIKAIAREELLRLFRTPTGWILLALVQFIQAWIFYRLVQNWQLSPVIEGHDAGFSFNIGARLLGSSAYIAMLIIPLLTMRSVCTEIRSGSLQLLFNSPASNRQIIIGKFLGLMGWVSLMMLMLLIMPLTLGLAGRLDYGLLLTAALGVYLLLASFTAIGLYLSSLTRQQALAAFATIAVLMLSWLFDLLANTGIGWLDAGLRWLSSLDHLEPLLRGLVDSRDIAWYLLITALFLGLATLRLRSLRQGG